MGRAGCYATGPRDWEVWGKERESVGGGLLKSKEALQVNDGPCLEPQTWTAAQTQTDDGRPEDGLARGERLILLPEQINVSVITPDLSKQWKSCLKTGQCCSFS